MKFSNIVFLRRRHIEVLKYWLGNLFDFNLEQCVFFFIPRPQYLHVIFHFKLDWKDTIWVENQCFSLLLFKTPQDLHDCRPTSPFIVLFHTFYTDYKTYFIYVQNKTINIITIFSRKISIWPMQSILLIMQRVMPIFSSKSWSLSSNQRQIEILGFKCFFFPESIL